MEGTKWELACAFHRLSPRLAAVSLTLSRSVLCSTACRADEQIEPLYPGYPECRVLIYNVAKKANVGTVVRTAVAFGATQIIVVGNVSNRSAAQRCRWTKAAASQQPKVAL